MDLYALRDEFTREGIIMCFNGPFSHSIIEEIGIAIRNHMAAENIEKMAVQDVFSIYIEMSQNARHYLQLKNITNAEASSATIVVARSGEAYSVSSGNFICNEDTGALAETIDRINVFSPEELKRAIRNQLRQELPPGARGAGIGLMEMAKRASGGLVYVIKAIDSRFSFFTLTVTI